MRNYPAFLASLRDDTRRHRPESVNVEAVVEGNLRHNPIEWLGRMLGFLPSRNDYTRAIKEICVELRIPMK